MRGAPHKGLAWRMRRIRSRMFAATSGLPGKAAGFPGPMPGESSAVPTEDRVGLNHLETSPPTGPESVDRKSTRLNSSHSQISYAVFCLKKKKKLHSH